VLRVTGFDVHCAALFNARELSAARFRQALVDFDRAESSEGRLLAIRVMGIKVLREAGEWLALHATRGVRPV